MKSRRDNAQGQGVPCLQAKPKLRKGLWSPDEDQKLFDCIMNNGLLGYSWTYVAKQAGLQRCGKSCRLRWINYLRPGIKRGPFSRQEERLIINLQSILGNRWSHIAACLPGRTDNSRTIGTRINKLKLKQRLSSSSNTKSNIFTDRTNINSVTRAPTITFNIVPTEENQSQFLSDCDFTNNNLSSQLWCSNNSYTHEPVFSTSHVFVSPNLQEQALNTYMTAKSGTCIELIVESCRTTLPLIKGPGSAEYSPPSTGIINPNFGESECLENIENGVHINDNQLMIDYSSLTASSGISGWSATVSHSYSNATDFSRFPDPGAYTTHDQYELLENGIPQDYVHLHHEKTTHQSCAPLNSVSGSQFSSPTITCAADQSSNLQAAEGEDRLNLRYGVSFGVSDYITMNSWQVGCNQIDRRPVISDQMSWSTIPNGEVKSNEIVIPTIIAVGGSLSSRLLEYELGEAGQLTAFWANEDDQLYNVHKSSTSHIVDQICFS